MNDKHIDATGSLISYAKILYETLLNVNGQDFDSACDLLAEMHFGGYPIIVMGNGGSAAIADHFVCDHVKGVSEDTGLNPSVYSLTSNGPLITALGNDIGYDKIFARQIRYIGNVCSYGLVIGMSVSGTSKNILKGFDEARKVGYKTMLMTGNADIKKKNYDYLFKFPWANYGVVEDCFSVMMHVMAQNIRSTHAIAPKELKR